MARGITIRQWLDDGGGIGDLIQCWANWQRCGGIPYLGYSRVRLEQPDLGRGNVWLNDAEMSTIDRVMCSLKKSDGDAYDLILCHYVKGQSYEQISRKRALGASTICRATQKALSLYGAMLRADLLQMEAAAVKEV